MMTQQELTIQAKRLKGSRKGKNQWSYKGTKSWQTRIRDIGATIFADARPSIPVEIGTTMPQKSTQGPKA